MKMKRMHKYEYLTWRAGTGIVEESRMVFFFFVRKYEYAQNALLDWPSFNPIDDLSSVISYLNHQ